MFHGYVIIDKALDVMDKSEKDDFRYYINHKVIHLIERICLFVGLRI